MRKPRTLRKFSKYDTKWGFIFISIWALGFLLWNLIPMLASVGFTMMNFDLITPQNTSFVGLDNWGRLFSDPEILSSVFKTFGLALIMLPILFIITFFLSLFLSHRLLIGKALFRALFFLPTMVPLVAVVLIWNGVLNNQAGWVNLFLQNVLGIHAVGSDGINWLTNPRIIYFAYTIIGTWGIGNTMLIFITGLQNVPAEFYEAAEIDGAGKIRQLIHITIPMVTPVIFFNLIIQIIGMLQYFLVPMVLNFGTGAPEGSTNFLMVYFYRQAFSYFNMGFGATLAWLIFIIALAITITLFRSSKNWVHYLGGDTDD